jgi:transaldolase
MKFFVDTADIEAIREVNKLGLIDGVTTNPSLIAKTGGNQHDILKEICAEIAGPVSAEVIAVDYKGMVSEGEELAKIADNIVIKVPLTEDGLKACKTLSEQNIMVNVTLCFSSLQALMAAKAGATFISPFVGRLDDIGHVGMDLIREIKAVYDNYGFGTEILVASIRHPLHVLEAALIGADVSTIPPDVILKLIKHPLTDKGLAAFLADHDKAKEQNS